MNLIFNSPVLSYTGKNLRRSKLATRYKVSVLDGNITLYDPRTSIAHYLLDTRPLFAVDYAQCELRPQPNVTASSFQEDRDRHLQ
jgi:hypothetical protein